ncbi:phosphoesterase RecJ domain-containing protein [Cetobacterium ceti]|uniref:Phosphoesterase RecJ domain-containing protein n=1 Tax=Cetobacterium ceti TaxID=180163 RepID=A0A1T4K252_9FUSO|nr:bifunctional oligoribonuclease/PAP phosphatase NrnA [Cetobacterium ceti]SJZ36514.1 phosphoesterase RecJ domain-containing protein [Cetobacterium ceti]
MKEILDKIKESNNIIISSHVGPDGDAIGAGLGLYLGLKKTFSDKKIDFILQDNVPKNLKFLKGTEEIKKFEEIKEKREYDLALVVDAATLERIGAVQEIIKDLFIINIDHHISNPKYGDINLVKNISSTSELMYGLLKEWNIKIDLEMGEAIYTGIVNDTGNFSHDNVTKKTFDIAGDLIESGVNNSKIAKDFYFSRSNIGIKLLGNAFENMVFIPEKKFTYYYLPYSLLEKLGGTKEDTEGLVEEINSSIDSEVSLFLRGEKDGKIKGSMRSKKDVDVNKIASIFGGGGHIKAAGFTSNLDSESIIEIVKDKL